MELSTNIVNLPHRIDRREHIISQFAGRHEFVFELIPAIEHEKGAYGLWQTVQKIVQKESGKENNFFILCEDDHTFTKNYSVDLLLNCIGQAQTLGADLLSGGYSWFGNSVQVSDNLFLADKFNGMQFTVIFRKIL
jgi:hypothetical protein